VIDISDPSDPIRVGGNELGRPAANGGLFSVVSLGLEQLQRFCLDFSGNYFSRRV
jgi:hypothetical protein